MNQWQMAFPNDQFWIVRPGSEASVPGGQESMSGRAAAGRIDAWFPDDRWRATLIQIVRASGFHGDAYSATAHVLKTHLKDALKGGRLIAVAGAKVSLNLKAFAEVEEKAPAPPPPTDVDEVNPIIDPEKLTVVVRKVFKEAASGATKPYTHPARGKVVLRTDARFEGTGTFSRAGDKVRFFKSAKGDDEIHFDGKDNVFTGPQLSGGVTVYVEANKPSAALDDVKITLAIKGGPKRTGPDAEGAITSVEVTLDICKSRPKGGGEPPVFSTDDKINVGRVVHVQSKDGRHERAMLIIRQVKPAAFKGDLVLKARGGVHAYKAEKVTKGVKRVDPFVIAADKVPDAGEKLWAQGEAVSADMRDTGFQLGIKGLEEDADHVRMTAVQVVLDLCESRTKKGVEPKPMSADHKVAVGRFVHEQDGSNHHGRAMLIVRQVKPKTFDGVLELKAILGEKMAVFEKETPSLNNGAIPDPYEIDCKKKNEDKELWVEGKAASGALRDAGFTLAIKDHPVTDGDKVAVTVVKFSHLKADVPSTPAKHARLGNSPVRRHEYERSGAAAHFDESSKTNSPLALVEGSVSADDPIVLTVKVTPAGVPVSWSAKRDARPPPDGDHHDIAKLSGAPTIHGSKADPLRATLLANAVGTFHVRPFVDCNGKGEFGVGGDHEPFMIMNMVFIRVKALRNESVAHKPRNAVAPPTPTGLTGVWITSGGNSAATAAVHQKAAVMVIGGGDAGDRGLKQLFAGWCQSIMPTSTSESNPKGLDIYAEYFNNTAPPPAPPTVHKRFFLFSSTGVNPALGAGRTVFTPAMPAPTVPDCPVLDVSPNRNEGTGGRTCVGTEGLDINGRPIPVAISKAPKTIGEEWVVEGWDSPTMGHPIAHGVFPGTMTQFRFNLDFLVDLVFWTNVNEVDGATDHAACRLYSSVQTNTWTVRYAIAFSPWTGMASSDPKVIVKLEKDRDHKRLARPVKGTSLETRGPYAGGLLAVSART